MVCSLLLSYFNSIKVRLEHYFNGVLPTPQLFQFHKGAIRTSIRLALQTLIPSFQFHKGAIRTLNYASARAAYANFNSIKVRLEPYPLPLMQRYDFLFQFHKGAIRTKYQNVL